MAASSVTGVGQGSADKHSPPKVKNDRLTGRLGPRVLMSGVGIMDGGETVITHPELPEWEDKDVIRVAISCSAYPVYVTSFNSTIFTVESQETGSFFSPHLAG